MSRNETTWRRIGIVAALAAWLLWASPAAAQVFRLGTWEGSLEGTTSWSRQDIDRTDAERSRFERLHTDEQLTIRNSGGYLLTPRLLTTSLGATVGYTQDSVSIDGTRTTDQGTLLGYNTFFEILRDQPLSLNIFANRDQSVVSRELAGESEITTENRGFTLFARRLYVPSTFTFRQEDEDEKSRTADIVARRSVERNIVRYEGQRGWEDKEVGATYEFIDDVDRVFPALSFRSHDGQLYYAMDFGEELNWHFDSRLHFTTRTGLTESTLWTATETLRVEHSEQLRSNYRYLFLRTETPAGETTTHDLAGDVTHQLWQSLITVAGVGASRADLVQGQKDAGRGHLDVTYTKRLPLGGRLTLTAGGSLQYEDDRFRAAETAVSQESHTAATPIALPIPLTNPFVVGSSIVVVKTAAGPLPLGCVPPPGPPTPLTLGVDYTTLVTGQVTEIVPIPCAGATPGINPGDTIAVDYRFAVSPAITFTTQTWHAGVSVDFRWIRLFANHDESTQSLVAGRDGTFLNDQRSTGGGAELRYDGTRLRASLLGEARQFRSTRVDYNSLSASARTDLWILPDLAVNLSLEQTITDFPDQHRETRTQAARLGFTYTAYLLGSEVFVSALGGVRQLRDTLQPDDETVEARLTARWRYRKLEFAPTLEYVERRRGETETTEYRALLKTIRRF